MAWYAEQHAAVESAFNTRASHRFSSMMQELRKSRIKPYWIGDDNWKIVQEKWDDPKYVEKCEKAKKNRASEKGGCINTGGSINSLEHYSRLVKFFTLLNLYIYIFHILFDIYY